VGKGIQGTGYRIYRITGTGYRIHDAGYRIQDARYRMQDTGYRIQDSRIGRWVVPVRDGILFSLNDAYRTSSYVTNRF
jgi:hypothetical protein